MKFFATMILGLLVLAPAAFADYYSGQCECDKGNGLFGIRATGQTYSQCSDNLFAKCVGGQTYGCIGACSEVDTGGDDGGGGSRDGYYAGQCECDKGNGMFGIRATGRTYSLCSDNLFSQCVGGQTYGCIGACRFIDTGL